MVHFAAHIKLSAFLAYSRREVHSFKASDGPNFAASVRMRCASGLLCCPFLYFCCLSWLAHFSNTVEYCSPSADSRSLLEASSAEYVS